MKYEAIRKYSPVYSVRKMCKVLGLKESGYYQWFGRYERNAGKRLEEQRLSEVVGEVFSANRCVYGYRKIQRALAKEGEALSVYRVRKIMRSNGYYPVVVKKHRPTRNGKADGRFYENKVQQQGLSVHAEEIQHNLKHVKTVLPV